MGHYGTHKNGDNYAGNDQETSDGFDDRKRFVGIQRDETTGPDADKISHKHLPSLNLKPIVEQSIHGHALYSDDLSSGSQTQNPGQEVPPASKPATNSAM